MAATATKIGRCVLNGHQPTRRRHVESVRHWHSPRPVIEQSLSGVERGSSPGGHSPVEVNGDGCRLHPVVVPCQRSQTTQAKTPFNASAALRCMVSVTCE